MQINISYPIFRCQHDEAVFLARLRELPNFSDLSRHGDTLVLTLESGAEVLPLLEDVCGHWNASFQVMDTHS